MSKFGTSQHCWTKYETEQILERYPSEGATLLAAQFGVTANALRVKAQRLGVAYRTDARNYGIKPPPPSDEIKHAWGMRSGCRLAPVPPEIEAAAIATFLATKEVTQCPPRYAAGGEGIQHIGFKQGTNRGARKL